MTVEAAPVEERTKAGTRVPLIDCDVHPQINGGFGPLLEYMPAGARERLQAKLPVQPRSSLEALYAASHVAGLERWKSGAQSTFQPEGIPPGGGLSASDPAFLRSDFVDKHGIDYALLIPSKVISGLSFGPELCAVITAASNDYHLERFTDEKMRLDLEVSPFDADLAVAEIERLGDHPHVAAVFVPLWDRPMSDRHHYPIYEAAIERGLPIAIHAGPGGISRWEAGLPGTPAGFPELFAAKDMLPQYALMDMIFNGTLERYPELMVIFIEWGFVWAPPMIWKLDAIWEERRAELPQVKKRPSEYVRSNIRWTTQPIDDPNRAGDLLTQLIEEELQDVLMWSSDFPHWDGDTPRTVLHRLSDQTKQKVFYDNAKTTLRL